MNLTITEKKNKENMLIARLRKGGNTRLYNTLLGQRDQIQDCIYNTLLGQSLRQDYFGADRKKLKREIS